MMSRRHLLLMASRKFAITILTDIRAKRGVRGGKRRMHEHQRSTSTLLLFFFVALLKEYASFIATLSTSSSAPPALARETFTRSGEGKCVAFAKEPGGILHQTK